MKVISSRSIQLSVFQSLWLKARSAQCQMKFMFSFLSSCRSCLSNLAEICWTSSDTTQRIVVIAESCLKNTKFFIFLIFSSIQLLSQLRFEISDLNRSLFKKLVWFKLKKIIINRDRESQSQKSWAVNTKKFFFSPQLVQ